LRHQLKIFRDGKIRENSCLQIQLIYLRIPRNYRCCKIQVVRVDIDRDFSLPFVDNFLKLVGRIVEPLQNSHPFIIWFDLEFPAEMDAPKFFIYRAPPPGFIELFIDFGGITPAMKLTTAT